MFTDYPSHLLFFLFLLSILLSSFLSPLPYSPNSHNTTPHLLSPPHDETPCTRKHRKSRLRPPVHFMCCRPCIITMVVLWPAASCWCALLILGSLRRRLLVLVLMREKRGGEIYTRHCGCKREHSVNDS